MRRIVVTQQHIDKATELYKIEGNIRSQVCPVNLAAKEVFPDKDVSTGSLNLYFSDNRYHRLPYRVTSKIERFDSRRKMEPFEFVLPG